MDGGALFEQTLRDELMRLSIGASGPQIQAMLLHYEQMVAANQMYNLTRITQPEDAAVLHYADSLAALLCPQMKGLPDSPRVLDLGTGAGFPAIPLALLRPEWKITAVDARAKKVSFLNDVVRSLGIANVRVDHWHSAHAESSLRFDLILSRALGALSYCLREAERFAKPGTLVVTYKTPTMTDEEVAEANRVSKELGFEELESFAYHLELRGESRKRLLDLRRWTGT